MSTSTIKRLEIIQNMIALGDRATLDAQVRKLEGIDHEPALHRIVEAVQGHAYAQAAALIENYTSGQMAVQTYEKPEVSGLHLEAKSLEEKLNALQNRKAVVEKTIRAFNVRYQRELGELVTEILKIRKEQAREAAKTHVDDVEKQEAYEEARADYNEYEQAYEDAQEESLHELSPEEKKELKAKYRRASKRCHPDTVAPEYEDAATETFHAIDEAYQKNDLERVREIAAMLEKGLFPGRKAGSMSDAEHLRAEVDRLRDKVEAVRGEIDALERSDAYRTVSMIDDRDTYFAERRERLQAQLNELREECHA